MSLINQIQLNLLPFVEKTQLLSERIINEQLHEERSYEADSASEFIKFASDWWEDFKAIRESHKGRLVKLFVPTEDKED